MKPPLGVIREELAVLSTGYPSSLCFGAVPLLQYYHHNIKMGLYAQNTITERTQGQGYVPPVHVGNLYVDSY